MRMSLLFHMVIFFRSVILSVFSLMPMSAFSYRLLGFDISMSNQLRQQAFILDSKREYSLLPESNGGPSYFNSPLYDPSTADPVVCSDGKSVVYDNVRGGTIDATLGALTSDALQYGVICQGVSGHSVPSYAGNINADDWRLNFDKGDVLQFPSSLNTSILAKQKFSFGDFSVTLNIETLYDSVLIDDGSFRRSPLTDSGKDQIARYINVDGFAQLKTRAFGNRGWNIIAGSQQIHWGEPTFLPGGISWFNPLDVPRFRQTGYDYGWIPVPALYSDIRFSRSLLFASYFGGWDHYRFDVPGTYAGVGGDSWLTGAGVGGNQDNFVIGSGTYFTGNSWPCHYADSSYWKNGTIDADTQQYAQVLSAFAPSCPGVSDVLTPLTLGLSEKERIEADDSWAMIPRAGDERGSNSYGFMMDYDVRRLNLSMQFSLQGGGSRLPMINYHTDKVKVVPYATGVTDGVIARGAVLAGLGTLATTTGSPYNSAYNSVSLNAQNGLVDALKSNTSLNTYGATAGSVAEMNALQYQMAVAQSSSVTASTLEGFESAGAMFTGAINIRPDFNLNIFGVYPNEQLYGFSAKYTGYGKDKIPLYMNVSYRPNTPLQFDVSELMLAGLFNNCMLSSSGALEPTLLNMEPYHNEFDLQKGQNRVGCRDYKTTLPGYTTEYNGWIVDLVGQGLYDQRRILGGDNLFARLQMRSIYVDGIASRSNVLKKETINGSTVTGPLMPLDNVCVSGSDLPLGTLVGLDPRDPIVCRPTEYSAGLLFGGGLNYNHVLMFGKPYTVTPGVFYAMGTTGRSPRPLGLWLKNVGYYIVGFEIRDNKRWSYDVQYRGYFGPSLYNAELGKDSFQIGMNYHLNT